MVTIQITHQAGSERREYPAPVRLSEALRDARASFSMPCGGNHTCGKCKVVATGALSPVAPEEEYFLTQKELAANIRLACFAVAQGAVTLTLLEQSGEQILTGGSLSGITPSADKTGYGIAVDIGTTTVAAYLYRMNSLNPIQVISKHNKQSKYGADVISRIEYCNQNGVEGPRQAILTQLDQLLMTLLAQAGAPVTEVGGCVITGNTTMLHLLTGLDPRGIAVAPFTPQSLFGEQHSAAGLGLQALPADCEIYLPQSISAYVGADITCAILASGMTAQPEKSLLVDIGTNGEMALYTNGQLKCCSTAAGPAFEGAGIKMGMPALAGAINRVWVEDGKLRYTTIRGEAPIGICGSGIIDAVAAMLEAGLIDETGRIEEGDKIPIGDSGITLDQADIRQLQLAKAAIRAGIDALLHECDISAKELDCFYIAGGFGSLIDHKSAAAIGLIPQEVVDRVKVIGNGAGMGASAALLSDTARVCSEQIAAQAENIELSGNPYFMDQYIACMMFE